MSAVGVASANGWPGAISPSRHHPNGRLASGAGPLEPPNKAGACASGAAPDAARSGNFATTRRRAARNRSGIRRTGQLDHRLADVPALMGTAHEIRSSASTKLSATRNGTRATGWEVVATGVGIAPKGAARQPLRRGRG